MYLSHVTAFSNLFKHLTKVFKPRHTLNENLWGFVGSNTNYLLFRLKYFHQHKLNALPWSGLAHPCLSWDTNPDPPWNWSIFILNNGFSYVLPRYLWYGGTKYEKEWIFREKRKEEESSLVRPLLFIPPNLDSVFWKCESRNIKILRADEVQYSRVCST